MNMKSVILFIFVAVFFPQSTKATEVDWEFEKLYGCDFHRTKGVIFEVRCPIETPIGPGVWVRNFHIRSDMIITRFGNEYVVFIVDRSRGYVVSPEQINRFGQEAKKAREEFLGLSPQ